MDGVSPQGMLERAIVHQPRIGRLFEQAVSDRDADALADSDRLPWIRIQSTTCDAAEVCCESRRDFGHAGYGQSTVRPRWPRGSDLGNLGGER